MSACEPLGTELMWQLKVSSVKSVLTSWPHSSIHLSFPLVFFKGNPVGFAILSIYLKKKKTEMLVPRKTRVIKQCEK